MSRVEDTLSICGYSLGIRIFGEYEGDFDLKGFEFFCPDCQNPTGRLILHILPDVNKPPWTVPVLQHSQVRARYDRRTESEFVTLKWNHLAILNAVDDSLEVFLLHSSRVIQRIEAFIFQSLAYLLAPRNGILIHGSGFALSQSCGLVTGPSGAGKSTSVRMIAPDSLLSDDMVGITKIDQEPIIWATPLGGLTDGPMNGPLRAIFFPKKASHFSIELLRPHNAFLKYWAEHSEYIHKLFAPYVAMYFKNAYELFQKVPAYELAFALDSFDREAVRNVLENPEARAGSSVTQR